MRLWESVELGVVALAVLGPVALGRRFKKGRISLLLVVAVTVQVVVEGFRWQLWPLHVVALAMAVTDWGWQGRRVAGWPRMRRLLLGVPSLVLLALPLWVLPVPRLPRPSGPFPIGTRTFVISDPERLEEYGLPDPVGGEEIEPSEPRRLVVQVWYPAAAEEDMEPVVWHPDWAAVGPVLAGRLGFPGFVMSQLSGVPGHAVEDARPMQGVFPVIVYSHGWTGFRSIAVDQMEMLASEGYLVIAADHTYGAVATVIPDDGVLIEFDPGALPDQATVEDFVYQDAARRLLATYADDLVMILDQMEDGAFGDLTGHADLDLIGMFGHSLGGGAVLEVCLEDERCKAVAGLDAWVEPVPDRTIAKPLTVPSMFMRSVEWIDDPNDARLRGLLERAEAPAILVGIGEANHNDFVLTPLFSPIADRMGLKGPIPADVIIPFLHDHLDSFFDRFLAGLGGVTFDRPPPEGISVEHLGQRS